MTFREAVFILLAGLLYGAGWAMAEKAVARLDERLQETPQDDPTAPQAVKMIRPCPTCEGRGLVQPA